MLELGSLMGALAERYPAAFVAAYAAHHQQTIELVQARTHPLSRLFGLLLVDGIIEFAKHSAAELSESFLPYFLHNATHEDVRLRQAAVFGIGLVAEFGPPSADVHIPTALKTLWKVRCRAVFV